MYCSARRYQGSIEYFGVPKDKASHMNARKLEDTGYEQVIVSWRKKKYVESQLPAGRVYWIRVSK